MRYRFITILCFDTFYSVTDSRQIFKNKKRILRIVFNECLTNVVICILHPTVFSLTDSFNPTSCRWCLTNFIVISLNIVYILIISEKSIFVSKTRVKFIILNDRYGTRTRYLHLERMASSPFRPIGHFIKKATKLCFLSPVAVILIYSSICGSLYSFGCLF